MTIRQYHPRHSIQEEDELFGAVLSADFDSYRSNTRPWYNQDPHLLDDGAPAYSIGHRISLSPSDRHEVDKTHQNTLFPDGLLIDDINGPSSHAVELLDTYEGTSIDNVSDGVISYGGNLNTSYSAIVEGRDHSGNVHEPIRYPLDELYPNINGEDHNMAYYCGQCVDDDTRDENVERDVYGIGDDDDYISMMQYSEPCSAPSPSKASHASSTNLADCSITNGSSNAVRSSSCESINGRFYFRSRYPIDEDYNPEEVKQPERKRQVQWFNEELPSDNHDYEEENRIMVLKSSKSDDEISTYLPLQDDLPENDDCTNEFGHGGKFICDSDDNRSASTFDRLYGEEYYGMSDSVQRRPSTVKEGKMDANLTRLSPQQSPDSILQTPGSSYSSIDNIDNSHYKPASSCEVLRSEDIILSKNTSPIDLTNTVLDTMESSDSGIETPTPLRSNIKPRVDTFHDDSLVFKNDTSDGGMNDFQEIIHATVENDNSKSNNLKSSEKNIISQDSQKNQLVHFHQPDHEEQELQQHSFQQEQQQMQHQKEERQVNCSRQDDEGMRLYQQWQKLQLKHQVSTFQTTQTVHNQKNSRPKLDPVDVKPLEPKGVRYFGDGENNETDLFPDMEWDENGMILQRKNSHQKSRKADGNIGSASAIGHYNIANQRSKKSEVRVSPPLSQEWNNTDCNLSNVSAPPSTEKMIKFSSHLHQLDPSLPKQRNVDDASSLDSISDASMDEDATNSLMGLNDDVSVISDDTGMRQLTESNSKKKKQQKRSHQYIVKQKDSMEIEMKLDSEVEATDSRPYTDVKRKDSLEIDMTLDFDEIDNEKEIIMDECNFIDDTVHRIENDDESKMLLISPPSLKRESNIFANIVDDDNSMQSNKLESDDTAGKQGPVISKSKVVSQMNLGNHRSSNEESESADLIVQACELLARGRNNDALRALNEAFNRAEYGVDHVKKMMDDHYTRNRRQRKSPSARKREQEEYEQKLDSDFRQAASTLADVTNNIGVVQEMNGDYHLALNSFRDALDIYRQMCLRYENTGDADVDRTVANIMQMGIAMRSDQRRQELHKEEEYLSTMLNDAKDSNYREQIQMEQLNNYISVLDLENEALGSNHPTVGFTLLKKGKLHVEMKHFDLATKNIQEAMIILKNSLGNIHPVVGDALVTLADMYNYHGFGDPISNRNQALKFYEEALIPLRESYGILNSNLAMTYNSIGIIYSINQDLELAITAFHNALASYGVRDKGDVTFKGKTHPDVTFVWINIGDLEMERKKWQLALKSYAKALTALRSIDVKREVNHQQCGAKILMRMSTARSDNKYVQNNDALMSSVLQNMGRAQCMLHQYGKAIESFEEALRIHRVIVMQVVGKKQSNKTSRDVARILENLGEVHMISGNLTSALECYIKSLNILRSVTDSGGISIETAIVLGAIGKVHYKKGEHVAAQVVLKECMRAFEKFGVPPNNRKYNEIRSCLVDAELSLMQNVSSTLGGQHHELSGLQLKEKELACDEIADSYKNKGDTVEAIWFFSEALFIRRSKLASLSGGLKDSVFVDIGRTLSSIAQLRLYRREFDAAKILFHEAMKLYKKVGLSQQHVFYKDLARQMKCVH